MATDIRRLFNQYQDTVQLNAIADLEDPVAQEYRNAVDAYIDQE